MKKRKLYVIVTRTNTLPSRVIRVCTHSPYNHVSLSFDKELRDMVSFGRLYPSFPVPGGLYTRAGTKAFFSVFRIPSAGFIKNR